MFTLFQLPFQAVYLVLLMSLLSSVAYGADLGPAVPLDKKGSAAQSPWQRYSDWPDTDNSKFNTLTSRVSPPVSTLKRIQQPIKGDAEKGAELAFDRARGGSCVACHIMGPTTPELPGNTGPDLSMIGNAGRTDEYFYNYIYDPRVYNPGSIMPPWGAHGLFNDEEIGHLIAFLKTLKSPAVFKTELDNPALRPRPVEDRDNLDGVENPGMSAVDEGMLIFSQAGPKGKSCASCHAKPEQRFKTWAAHMPKYSAAMKKVLGVEEFITRHGRATTGNDLAMQSDANTGLAVYLRYLANGTPIKVGTGSPGEKQAIANGRQLVNKKIGQLNFSCTDCHSPEKGANKWIRGQWLGESRGQLDHFPTWRTSRAEIWDIRKRFQWCNVAIRADELPPDASVYGDIELYLSTLNQGLPLSVPGIRH